MKHLFKLFTILILPLALVGCNEKSDTPVQTAKIELNGEAVSLDPGQTYTLTPLAYDVSGNKLEDKVFKYTTSNANCVEVNQNGLIVAKKKGYSTVCVISDTQIKPFYVTVGGTDEELIGLDFSPSEVTVKLGASYTPTLVTFPSGLEDLNYRWYSNDESIATVEDGKVIGKAVGTTEIIAVYQEISATLKVTVSEQGGSVFTISLNRDNISLITGGSFQLVATCSEEATITWASENSGRASVDKDGLVIANGKGSTVITATANGVTASCTVVVSDGEEPEEYNLKIFFYIDYNNIETPYVYADGLDWYTGVPFGLENMPAAPSVAPDPAFPNFAGWSNHTIIDDLNDLWDFESDVVPEGTYTYVLYGIWFD